MTPMASDLRLYWITYALFGESAPESLSGIEDLNCGRSSVCLSDDDRPVKKARYIKPVPETRRTIPRPYVTTTALIGWRLLSDNVSISRPSAGRCLNKYNRRVCLVKGFPIIENIMTGSVPTCQRTDASHQRPLSTDPGAASRCGRWLDNAPDDEWSTRHRQDRYRP